MDLFNNFLCIFILLLIRFLNGISAIKRAPGTLTLKIQTPAYVEGCNDKHCKYVLQTCVGSGRSENERCLWSPLTNNSNYLHKMPRYLAEISFEVDNVKESFYFNAKLSYYQNESYVKTDNFENSILQSLYQPTQIHSQDFSTLSIDISVKCKPGFFPKNKCLVSCFEEPSVYKCDENGKKLCLSGYVFDSMTNKCNFDNCKSENFICLNNGTCVSGAQGPKCLCSDGFSGPDCEYWDPCTKPRCKNEGKCIKTESKNDYICFCKNNYYGKNCEKTSKSCTDIICERSQLCEIINNQPKCSMKKSSKKFVHKTFVTSRSIGKTTITMTKQILSNIEAKIPIVEAIPVGKGTNRLSQSHSLLNEYTTTAIVIVLVVFMIGCFGVAFWILKIKYFHKKSKTYSNFSTLPVMPSIYNASTYRSSEENFRRWHSLDDNSFYLCSQGHMEPYHTYRSGSNVYPKHDQGIETCRDGYGSLNSPHRMCHSIMRTRMPVLCEPSTVNSSDLNFKYTNDSQNNSEKVDDYNNNYLVIDNPPTSDL